MKAILPYEPKCKPTLILEGILDSISEIKPIFVLEVTGEIIGSKAYTYKKQVGIITKLKVKTTDGKLEEIKYNQYILPDSIGHNIEVYTFDGRIQIQDIDLSRWYK